MLVLVALVETVIDGFFGLTYALKVTKKIILMIYNFFWQSEKPLIFCRWYSLSCRRTNYWGNGLILRKDLIFITYWIYFNKMPCVKKKFIKEGKQNKYITCIKSIILLQIVFIKND